MNYEMGSYCSMKKQIKHFWICLNLIRKYKIEAWNYIPDYQLEFFCKKNIAKKIEDHMKYNTIYTIDFDDELYMKLVK